MQENNSNSLAAGNGTSFIDDIMGIDPTSLDVFQEKPSNSARNANVYKPSPSLSKADDGHYRSRLRLLFNPLNVKRSIVPQTTYTLHDDRGMFFVKSMLAENQRDCPIFKSWKTVYFGNSSFLQTFLMSKYPGDTNAEKRDALLQEFNNVAQDKRFTTELGQAIRDYAKQMFERSETQWCLVQILEDNNQPEMVGQVKVMKLPKVIFTKLTAKMNPSAESKKEPVPVMDYLIGLPLEMDVTPGPDDPKQPQRKTREISYDLCEFDTDYAPIIKTDGSNLFTDSELETIDAFDAAKKKVAKAKTDKAKADAQKEVEALKDAVRALYQKALTYLKDEAHVVDLEKECAYQPWDQATTDRVNRWIDNVLNMRDPKNVNINETAAAPVEVPLENAAEAAVDDMMGDVPF